MAVGSIANISISAYTTYINVSFAKPANTTKFLVVLVDPNTGYTFYSNYFSSGNATGNTVTCKVTGVIAGNSYIVYVTPYNGTTAGTVKQYLNSSTSNLVKIPSTVTSSQSNTSVGTTLSKTSTGQVGPITTGSATGSPANGGSTAPSSAAPANTPVFNAGSVNGSIPLDINSSARISQKIEGLEPNTPYSIKVRAVTTDANGNTIYSEWSPNLNIITPGYSTDGNNFQSVNNATDIQLSGGSIFAGTFDVSTGVVDVVNDTVSGSGVILNQTGLLGVNNGTKEFYIDSRTGNAYFAGTIAATIIESTNYAPTTLTDGSAFATSGMAINLNNGAITSEKFRIDTNGNAYFAGDVSGNATISGVLASTVVSNSSLGASAYAPATSAIQPGQFVTVDNTHQIVKIDTSGGIIITSSATASTNGTSRLELNNNGLFAYNGNTPTVQILSNGGDAIFAGQITAKSGFIGTAAQGWSITGSYFQSTGASGAGGLVLDSANNSLSVKGGNNAYAHIVPAIINGFGTGMFIHYGGSPQPNGPTGTQIKLDSTSVNLFSDGSASSGYVAVANSSSVIPGVSIGGSKIYLLAPIDVSNSSVSLSSASSTNGLKGIKSQSGGSASGGNDGDIILIY
jgi:hypothetical protein